MPLVAGDVVALEPSEPLGDVEPKEPLGDVELNDPLGDVELNDPLGFVLARLPAGDAGVAATPLALQPWMQLWVAAS